MTDADNPDRLMTVREIAERWQVSPKTVTRLIARACCAASGLGGRFACGHPMSSAWRKRGRNVMH